MSASATTNIPAKIKVTEAVAAVSDATTAAASKTADVLNAGIEKTQKQVKEGIEKIMKTAEELVAFGQGNLEAFVKSGQIWAAGVQDIQKQVAATARTSFEETVANFRAFTDVKSLKEAMDLQAQFARNAITKTVTESGRITDASVKLAEQTLAPITARVNLAFEKFAKAA
jgi:phasin family protein